MVSELLAAHSRPSKAQRTELVELARAVTDTDSVLSPCHRQSDASTGHLTRQCGGDTGWCGSRSLVLLVWPRVRRQGVSKGTQMCMCINTNTEDSPRKIIIIQKDFDELRIHNFKNSKMIAVMDY